MSLSRDADLGTPEEALEQIYHLTYGYARDRLQEGLHADAVRFGLHMAVAQGPVPLPGAAEVEWRGLEDALAGRAPLPRGGIRERGPRTWRVDQGTDPT
jgi:hypothetical protein